MSDALPYLLTRYFSLALLFSTLRFLLLFLNADEGEGEALPVARALGTEAIAEELALNLPQLATLQGATWMTGGE